MIRFTQGNLLDADAQALVNTVNTVGVMGKGVALMFKEAYPENFKAYEEACRSKEVQIAKMFVTERRGEMFGPKWIVNFPTKTHWRFPSKMEWIVQGLEDLKRVIKEKGIKSVALPPLGAGNGGLAWKDVRPKIEAALAELNDIDVIVYEPTARYQNVAKRTGSEKLTVTRALIAELVRRYSILGFDCTLLEIQKLAYFLERFVVELNVDNQMNFQFSARKFGPYSKNLKHLLDGLDGSYLHCDKRLGEAASFDVIHFDDSKKDKVSAYLTSPDVKAFRPALEKTSELIDGFESPLGMELLSTVDWLVNESAVEPNVAAVRERLATWPGGKTAGERKLRLFEDRTVGIALSSLVDAGLISAPKKQARLLLD
jgi:O-acetyl-ADP-ribose deacetylase (regulator of RNase III)